MECSLFGNDALKKKKNGKNLGKALKWGLDRLWCHSNPTFK